MLDVGLSWFPGRKSIQQQQPKWKLSAEKMSFDIFQDDFDYFACSIRTAALVKTQKWETLVLDHLLTFSNLAFHPRTADSRIIDNSNNFLSRLSSSRPTQVRYSAGCVDSFLPKTIHHIQWNSFALFFLIFSLTCCWRPFSLLIYFLALTTQFDRSPSDSVAKRTNFLDIFNRFTRL